MWISGDSYLLKPVENKNSAKMVNLEAPFMFHDAKIGSLKR